MSIDRNVIERDARNNIADWPATIRVDGKTPIVVHLNATSDIEQVLEGGLLDDMEVTLVCIASDFSGVIPENHTLVEIQQRDGTWQQFEVKRRPDAFDPVSPTFQLVVGSPGK